MCYLLNPKIQVFLGLSLYYKVIKNSDFPYLPVIANLHMSSIPLPLTMFTRIPAAPGASCLIQYYLGSRKPSFTL